MKQNIYSKKKMLKGTGIVIKEDLTKEKMDLVNILTESLNFRNVWTLNGIIYVFHKNNIQKIRNRSECNSFISRL
nr:unnamed protein product [Callosobruchus analis]CAI5833861.1 unnamed protein product [Callosobruchus analis]CAI5850822.1 unnamed protein product [Callosobruchus analis]CAI5853806.1 unnamed protein product [Callosobruchus analis]CAI5866463.1 unnamed protein product [Callosobruchus analis]